MASNFVNVSIESEANQVPTDKRYDPQIKIIELKKKLELITGVTYTSMKLTSIVDDNEIELSNDEETLAHYTGDAQDVIKLVVKDQHPPSDQGGDTPKFVISEDKYLQRPDNARNFIKQMREKRNSGK